MDTNQKTYIPKGNKSLADPSKGQKIAAALYLITNHLSDTDPFKQLIRTHGLALLDETSNTAHIAKKVIDLLAAAVLARVVGEHNAAIVRSEIAQFASMSTDMHAVAALFTPEQTPNFSQRMSVMSDKMSVTNKRNVAIYDNKSKRQTDILAFINERRSVGIKDITRIFTDVSEKTIQRELGVLAQEGKITKRGSKRWSIYLAVS